MCQSPQPWLSHRRQYQQTLHPTSAHSDCDQSLQPIDWQGQPAACLPGGSWPKDGYTSGGFMGHVHLPPIPQHPRTPGHKAFRSQLTANELGGIRFAGVVSKWSTIQSRSARANPLTTKGSGDLGSISSHEDPTPIGDAGCPWEWHPTDITPRDITLEGLPPPSPYKYKLSDKTQYNFLEHNTMGDWCSCSIRSLSSWQLYTIVILCITLFIRKPSFPSQTQIYRINTENVSAKLLMQEIEYHFLGSKYPETWKSWHFSS